jgi:hypothetical protein
MKAFVWILILLPVSLPDLLSAQGKNELVITANTSKATVRKALRNSQRIFLNGPLENCDQVIGNAQLLLFKVYSRKRILNEKPYHCFSDEIWWHLYGDLPNGSLGGVFEVIISKETREVMKIIHTQ